VGSPSIHRIERSNYALAAIVVLVGLLTQSRPIVLGLMVGSALTCLNFYVLRRLVVKWTSDAATGKGGGAASMLMLPKMIGLMGAVAVAVLLLPLDVIAFTIGYSIFIVSIVFETVSSSVLAAFRAPAQDPDSEHPNG
jgi:hypothetical protein